MLPGAGNEHEFPRGNPVIVLQLSSGRPAEYDQLPAAPGHKVRFCKVAQALQLLSDRTEILREELIGAVIETCDITFQNGKSQGQVKRESPPSERI